MRFQRLRIRNFKLLRDIDIEFSVDPAHPLTVVRAENGSGKTSLHYAMLWGLYGTHTLKQISGAADIRLTSYANPPGAPVTVEVSLDVEVSDAYDSGIYRLQRRVEETAFDGGVVERSAEEVTLVRLDEVGDKPISDAKRWIEGWLPSRLAEVFFTNGDDVQRFTTGKIEVHERQEKVHRAIKNLLGINLLSQAVKDTEVVQQKYDRKASQAAGAKVERLADEYDKLKNDLAELSETLDKLTTRRHNMEHDKAEKARELDAIKGIGELDELNAEIAELERDSELLEQSKARTLKQIRELYCSEAHSWSLTGHVLGKSTAHLDELTDRGVIPDTAVQVLKDRLDKEVCICDESLDLDSEAGSRRRAKVLELLERQSGNSDLIKHLSELRSHAGALRDVALDPAALQQSRDDLLQTYASICDELRRKSQALNQAIDQRKLIDDEKVQRLTREVSEIDQKRDATIRETTLLEARIPSLKQALEEKKAQLDKAQKEFASSRDHLVRKNVSADLLGLAQSVQKRLEEDYVGRVSGQMEAMFLEIVGTTRDLDQAVYTNLTITKDFDIQVGSQHGAVIDPDFDVNGASQRALTLSFVWSLMEVAGVIAPRFIDTPLGMVSGETKRRLVDAITRPPTDGQTPFQVVLLLTRSEIAGVEELLDERAGRYTTLSCSHHYPSELTNKWLIDGPVSVTCLCSHREQCGTCARRLDNQLGLRFVERS